jgi:plasmid stabilization system protein ParE
VTAPVPLLTFDQVLERSQDGDRHLLLGNGFSIGAWSGFQYESLFAVAREQRLISPEVERLAAELSSSDFERIVRYLAEAEVVLRALGSADELADAVRCLARGTREAMLRAIVKVHPDRPNAIGDDQFVVAARFLSHFDGVFTLSYDLLLYWTTLSGKKHFDLLPRDGFLPESEDGPLLWRPDVERHLFFLHGALHLFEDERRVEKLRFRKDSPLKAQFQSKLEGGQLPLLVAEGASAEKWRKIQASEFLRTGFEALSSVQGTLVVFGFALNDNDEHVFAALRRAIKGAADTPPLERVFIGLHGGSAKHHEAACERWTRLLASRMDLELRFFASESAGVWPSQGA